MSFLYFIMSLKSQVLNLKWEFVQIFWKNLTKLPDLALLTKSLLFWNTPVWFDKDLKITHFWKRIEFTLSPDECANFSLWYFLLSKFHMYLFHWLLPIHCMTFASFLHGFSYIVFLKYNSASLIYLHCDLMMISYQMWLICDLVMIGYQAKIRRQSG